MKTKHRKLVHIVMTTALLVVIVLNAVQSLVVGLSAKNSIEKSYQTQCSVIADSYSDTLSTKLSEYIKQLRMYTSAEVNKGQNPAEIQKWLVSIAGKRTPDYDRIGYIDASGNFYNDQGKITNVVDRDYFKSIMQRGEEFNIDDPVISKSTGVPIIHVSGAVQDGGRTTGMYSAVVGVDKLVNLVNGIKVGSDGYSVLLDSTGKVIASSLPDSVIEKAGGADSDYFTSALKEMASSSSSNGELSWKSLGKAGRYLVASRPVENCSWTYLLIIGEKQVYSTAQHIVGIILVCAVVLIISLALMLGPLIFRALKPLGRVEQTVEGIANGDADLTQRIEGREAEAANEIGALVRAFNRFVEKLHDIIRSVKASKERLVSTGERLGNSTQDTAASITQIISNIESMGRNITSQSSSVDSTAGAVNEIASNIESLNKMIMRQGESVSQASSAVEQMISNIGSVNGFVEQMVQAFDALEKDAVNGSHKQKDVNTRISQIQEESESLKAANAVISSIAEQTNLLAMNAAIEAAHAGEAGKGFSVVADEIRKLSETSSTQSKTIGNQLNKINESIVGIVAAGRESQMAFDSVAQGIRNTDERVLHIKQAMKEQTEGSKQIGQALSEVNSSTAEVRTASAEMSAGNAAILEEIRNLQDATLSMKTGMDEMAIGAKKINETGALLSELSHEMGSSIDDIGEQIDKFKV